MPLRRDRSKDVLFFIPDAPAYSHGAPLHDLLAEAFAGNVRGMGPGVAEIEFVHRKSEPAIVFMADKASPSAYSLPLYRIFADPFCSAGLVIDPKLHDGFRFEVLDIEEARSIRLDTPEELYDLLALSVKEGSAAASR